MTAASTTLSGAPNAAPLIVDSNLTVSLLPMPNNFVVHAFELAELQVSAEQRRKRHESVSEPAQFNPS